MAARDREDRKLIAALFSQGGWPDAAYGDLSKEDRCRLGYVIRLISPSLLGPCHILRRTSQFTRKLVKGTLGREEHASNEMVDHMALPREF